MADRVTFEMDTAGLLAAFARLGMVADRLVAAAAKETALEVRADAASRFSAQTHGTGQTAQNLVAVEDRSFQGGTTGYLVFARAIRRPANLSVWFEYGTARMRRRPFLVAAATAARAGYLTRIQAALDKATAEAGG